MAFSPTSFFFSALLLGVLCSSATAGKAPFLKNAEERTGAKSGNRIVGGVYAMSNNITENAMVVYGRRADGLLVLIDREFKTGGKGSNLDTGSGFDPFLSSFAVIIANNKFVLAVNAGSNSVSVFKILRNFSLRLVSVTRIPGFGPVSIAYTGSIIYVASIDADGEFAEIQTQKGLLAGFRLTRSGRLRPIRRSIRLLSFRPAAIQFSPDGGSLLVSDAFAGVNVLVNDGRQDEIVVYSVVRKGRLSSKPVGGATSTLLGNSEGRNLPGAVGFEIVKVGSVQYVVVTEFRGAGPDGVVANPQTGSISSWRLDSLGRLFPVALDVLTGPSETEGLIAPCWIEFSKDLDNFWVAVTPASAVAAFSFNQGRPKLLSESVATGTLPSDLWLSSDGKFLYQLFVGSVGVLEVENKGRGYRLTQIQNPMNVPDVNALGIVAI